MDSWNPIELFARQNPVPSDYEYERVCIFEIAGHFENKMAEKTRCLQAVLFCQKWNVTSRSRETIYPRGWLWRRYGPSRLTEGDENVSRYGIKEAFVGLRGIDLSRDGTASAIASRKSPRGKH